jgi:hypothetical protein
MTFGTWQSLINGKVPENVTLEKQFFFIELSTLEWPAHLNYVIFCLSLRFVFFCTL